MEEIIGDNFLDLAIEYVHSPKFINAIESFIDQYKDRFVSTSESKSQENLPLEYNDYFIEYQQLIDNLFERFAERNNASTAQVYECFRDSADNKFTPLFEENQHKWFVDKVVSWMDFDGFLDMMHKEARASNRRK